MTTHYRRRATNCCDDLLYTLALAIMFVALGVLLCVGI
jgi:hypothetical protein